MIVAWIEHRGLLWNLCLRELRVRYKQSLLGAAWALFVPLAMMVTFALVFGRITRLADSFSTGMPYPVFLYIGLLPWIFFTQSITTATNSLVANRSLVTKVYFPREVFPFSAILSCLFDFVLGCTVLVGLIAWYHFSTPWRFELHAAVAWIPLAFGVQLLFTAGLALWLCLANLFFRDVKYLVSVGLQLAMFLTNVIYPLPTSGSWWGGLLTLNPMIPIIAAYRRCLIDGLPPEGFSLAIACLVSIATCASACAAFRSLEPRFAESI